MTLAGTAIELRVFGGLAASGPHGPIPLGGRQERTLLALLVVHRPAALSTERLVDLLWPDEAPPTAAKTVQVYIGRLRGSLGAVAIERSADAYRLSPAVSVDADTVEADIRTGLGAAPNDPLVALDRLDAALDVAFGEPFADVALLPSIELGASRLDDLVSRAREGRFGLLLRLGRLDQLLAELPAAARSEPLSEHLWLTLMRAQAADGRTAEAVATYEDASRALREELGVAPDRALTELRDALVAGVDDGGPFAGSVERYRSPFTTHLPAPASAFIGRAALVDELADRLRPGGARLITLTGPGGIGKTRLAIEVAHRLTDAFDGAVGFIDLATVDDAALLWPTIRDAFGLEGTAAGAIGDRRSLLVIDNPERMATGAAAFSALLHETPRMQIVAASRVPLRIRDEEEAAVEPLSEEDAAELFAARARAADAPRDDRELVGAICARLDRLPLAIELAALQSAAFPAADLLRALDQRLPTLVGGPRDAPLRHQTIEATIGWSYELLEEHDARVFARLAVFEGGWTVAAAEAICAASHDSLRVLVEHSLVRRSGERMAMLDTIREYAGVRLDESGERPALLRDHAQWFLDEARRQEVAGAATGGSYRLLSDDVANQRIAMRTLCDEPNTDPALDLALVLWSTWMSQGRVAEGDGWFREAMARSSGPARPDWAGVLSIAGEFPRYLGDLSRAEDMKLEAIRLARQAGNLPEVASSLTDVADVARTRGDGALARRRYEEALAIRRELGTASGIAHAAHGLAELAADEGALDEAKALYDETIAISRDRGLLSREIGGVGAEALIGLGRVELQRGNRDRAEPLIVEGLAVARTLSTVDSIRMGLEALAAVRASSDEPSEAIQAAVLIGAAAGIRERADLRDDSRHRRDPVETTLRERLGPEVVGSAQERGRSASLEAILDEHLGSAVVSK
jgi:predicted ATPase/DNA-binding SARP family transcriptional activator